MGRHETLLYSKVVSPEQIAEAIVRKTTNETENIICKTKTLCNINVKNIKMFGQTTPVKPIHLTAGTEGLLIACDNWIDPKLLLPVPMRFKVKTVRIESIILSADKEAVGMKYHDYFIDAGVTLNGKTYHAKLHDEKKEIKGISVKEQIRKAKKEISKPESLRKMTGKEHER